MFQKQKSGVIMDHITEEFMNEGYMLYSRGIWIWLLICQEQLLLLKQKKVIQADLNMGNDMNLIKQPLYWFVCF